jgi:hypothetical protein
MPALLAVRLRLAHLGDARLLLLRHTALVRGPRRF